MRNRSPAKAQAAMNGGKRQDPYPGGNLVPPQRARSPSKHRSPSPNGAGHLPNMAVVAPSPFVAAAITPRGKPANGAAKRERTPPAILGRRVLPNMPLGEVAQAMKQRNVDRFTPSGEVSYIRGDLVEYHSGSYKCWVPTHVEQVDLETGAVTVAVRPREPIRKEDLKTLIRRRRKPSFEQLEWVRRLLSTGRIESEAETIFALHASRLGGGEWGLVPGSFLIVASDIDEKTGVSGFLRGLYSEYQRYSVEYLSLEQFQSLFWDHLQFAKECTRIIPQGNDRYRYSADPKQAYNFKDWKVLGEGTFGKVVLAYTHGTNDRRAVKLVNKGGLNQNFDFLAREIDNLCNLDHPHIARLYEYMEDAKTLYLVMDFCSGGDLHQKIRAAEKSRQPLRESYIAEAMRQVLFAIGYVHARGICHLDLKPANIMLMPSKAVNPPVKDAVQTVPKDFEKPHVCVIDFGVAQFFSAGSFRNGRPAGTPYTMAPEVWKGEITPKADIWSVGVTMFEMCCARFPYDVPGDVNSALSYWRAEPQAAWSRMKNRSEDARRAMEEMMLVDRRRRPGCSHLLSLPVFKNLSIFRKGVPMPKEIKEVLKVLEDLPNKSLLYMSISLEVAQRWPANHNPNVKALFTELNMGGHGRLERNHLTKGLVGLGMDESVANLVAEAADVGKEGCIEWTSFVAACTDLGHPDFERYLEKTFNRADADHDGLLTYSEIADLLPCDAGLSREIFQELTGRQDPSAKLDYPTFLEQFTGVDSTVHVAGAAHKHRHKGRRGSSNGRNPHDDGMLGAPGGELGFGGEAIGLFDVVQDAFDKAKFKFFPSAPDPCQDEENLNRLDRMGFKDRHRCLQMLRRHRNKITATLVEELAE
eukprot:CAMPEP_0206445972 /NCGR_PEP_ID=MMETSP0324_2-20121206/15849_1 /ASSEMBLY_ACC=CAM_ASM_000836 /TAXON_ID=2866 /ORGANISM="Crypthecodinium cohnii, Strain Seligo" /LENGTH=866 /DNA_ID=CAMNT_0053914335 /DNA_START=251 /DNA_END=2851 /DNA_ORIENTATION=+